MASDEAFIADAVKVQDSAGAVIDPSTATHQKYVQDRLAGTGVIDVETLANDFGFLESDFGFLLGFPDGEDRIIPGVTRTLVSSSTGVNSDGTTSTINVYEYDALDGEYCLYDSDSVVTAIKALQGFFDATGLATEATLATRAAEYARANRHDSADTYTAGEVLADQAGADGVLTFTFASAMDLIWVRSDGENARADPYGGTPAEDLGIICEDATPNPLTINTSEVKVWAPAGATVNIWGYRYA